MLFHRIFGRREAVAPNDKNIFSSGAPRPHHARVPGPSFDRQPTSPE